MGTINSALSIASQALDADQQALNVVANNVANANTPGYTEEKPNWQENSPLNIDGVTIGQGVTETGATSVRDKVLTARLDQQQQLASASGSRLTALDTLQALFTPDSGSSSSMAGDIGSDITSFFDTFSSLEANPTNNSDAPGGAFRGENALRRHLQCRGQPELAEIGAGPGGVWCDQSGELADLCHCPAQSANHDHLSQRGRGNAGRPAPE
jgi:hypothetical protein